MDKDPYSRLLDDLHRYGSMAVAFSGGVDSTMLARAAADLSGVDVLLVTVHTVFQPEQEIRRAGYMAEKLGLAHRVLSVDLAERPDILANPRDRCYWCKELLFSRIREVAREKGLSTLVHGANLDDFSDFRPGMKAAEELGFRAPLADCGLTKQMIRQCSEKLGLETWNMPSGSCLAARIPYGELITSEKLSMIEQAEEMICNMGFENIRVRLKGTDARIEVAQKDIERFARQDVRDRVLACLKQSGFAHISLDLQGYRTGSMNEV
ncbi:MAG: ATP-dependent sacrificial sulfur transferase LarE [Desulfarculaceae bacterium]|nr:ATP-dependent sacrificial sulfur transferase LarE [Desulfarculaceae bacterium]